MSKVRTVTCPHCNNNHSIKSRATSIQRHFSVQRNSQGLMEFEMEIPSGVSVNEWVIDKVGLQDRMILSLFGGTCVTIPYTLLCGLADMTTQGLMVTSVAVLGLASTVSMVAIEYLYSEHDKAARWAINRYQKAVDPVGETSDSDTLKLEVSEYREESQANNKAYRYIDGLNVTADQFAEWVFQIIENGKSLAIGQWTGSGKLFTRSQYDELMSKLKDAGIVVKSPSWKLTRGGRAALMAYNKGV